MKTRIILILICCSITGLSQGIDSTLGLSKNQITIQLSNEFNKPRLDNNPLNTDFELVTCGRNSLKVSYRRQVYNDFGVYLKAGYGIGAFSYWDNFYDSVAFPARLQNYTWHAFWDDFSNLEIGVNYQKEIFSKHLLNTSLGFGYNYSDGYGWGVSHGGYSNNTELELDLVYNNAKKPKLFFDVGLSRILKSKNLLTLSLSYEYSFKEPYYGTYEIYRNNIFQYDGEFFGPKSNFGINASYTFTGQQLLENSVRKSIENGTSYDFERKEIKKEKRYIHPKSIFVGVGTGLFFTKNKIKDKDSPFESAYYPWWSVNGFAEIGIKNDYFYEFGFGMEEYASGRTFKNIENSKGWSNMYIASKFSGGFGKRFIHKPTNKKIFNIHTGLGVILTYNTNRTSGGSSGGGYYRPQDTITFTAIDDYKLLFAPTLYVMLEKDFQVTKNFFISLRYRYDQGIFPMFKQDIYYKENGVEGTTQNLVYGTSQTYGFALKYKFLQRKYK